MNQTDLKKQLVSLQTDIVLDPTLVDKQQQAIVAFAAVTPIGVGLAKAGIIAKLSTLLSTTSAKLVASTALLIAVNGGVVITSSLAGNKPEPNSNITDQVIDTEATQSGQIQGTQDFQLEDVEFLNNLAQNPSPEPNPSSTPSPTDKPEKEHDKSEDEDDETNQTEEDKNKRGKKPDLPDHVEDDHPHNHDFKED